MGGGGGAARDVGRNSCHVTHDMNFCNFLLIRIIVRQGPIAHAVGVGGGCLDIFKFVYLFSFLSPYFGDGPI